MNITKFDVTLLLVMGIAVVSMSFVMPELGLADVNANESDIPELNIEDDRFDIAGEQPRFPNTASSGSLYFNTTQPAEFSDNRIWLNGDTTSGYELLMISSVNDTPEVILNRWDSGSVNSSDSIVINNSTPRGVLSTGEYQIAIEEAESNNPPDYLATTWDITEQPGVGGSWVGRIPVVGTLFDGAEAVASILGWITIVFIWFSQTLVGFSMNAINIMFQMTVYFISLINWLVTTYGTVVSSAPGWTSIFVALPGIILSVTLGKMVVIFIGLLPTT